MELTDMNELVQKIKDLRDKEKEAKEVTAKISAELESTEQFALSKLLDAGIASYRAPAGLIGSRIRRYVSMPKDPEKRALLFEFLEKTNRENMVTIHSGTLNSLDKELCEQAEAEGNEWAGLPGVDPAKEDAILSFRRS